MFAKYDASCWDETKGMSDQEVADYYSTWAVNGKYDQVIKKSIHMTFIYKYDYNRKFISFPCSEIVSGFNQV